MKRFTWIIYGVIGIFFISAIIYGAVLKLPGRTVTWENTPTVTEGLKDVLDFLKETFVSNEMNILVIGKPGQSDGQTYHGAELADAMVLVHFDPDKKKAYLISIPRDLWIEEGQDQYKLNEIIYKKKVLSALSKVGDITGIKPNGYVVVDLGLVASVIDDIGGVDVILKEAAVDWVSGYTLAPGEHHLTGEDAVWLMRNRFNSQGDFFREHNQQAVVQNAFAKFKELGRSEKLDLVKKYLLEGNLLENASINYSDIATYLFGGELESIQLESIVLDFSTKLFKSSYVPILSQGSTTNVSVLVPIAGFENYKEVREYIKGKINSN